MKYKNISEKPIKIRLGTLQNYIWKTVKPGQSMEMPLSVAESTGMVPEYSEPETTEKIVVDKVIEEKPEIVIEEQEENLKIEVIEKEIKDFKKKLISIKGVGSKSASDIVSEFSTEKELIKAIKDGKEIHNNDRIDQVVKEFYE